MQGHCKKSNLQLGSTHTNSSGFTRAIPCVFMLNLKGTRKLETEKQCYRKIQE